MDPLSMAGMGIGILGSLFGGIMGLFSGNQQQKIAQANANQDLRTGGVNSEIAFEGGQQTAAKAATQAAANGGGLTGSALGVIQQDSSNAMFNARVQTYRAQTQAQSDLYQGATAQANGVNQLISGVVGAAGTGVSDAASAGFRSSILSNRDVLMGEPYALMGTGF